MWEMRDSGPSIRQQQQMKLVGSTIGYACGVLGSVVAGPGVVAGPTSGVSCLQEDITERMDEDKSKRRSTNQQHTAECLPWQQWPATHVCYVYISE